MTTVQECLWTLGASRDISSLLEDCLDATEEFKRIKRLYFDQVLHCHPDKGGDVSVFRAVQAAFETLRQLYDDRHASTAFSFADALHQHGKSPVHVPMPSWDYFQTAAQVPVPTYRVELAKSKRSKCTQRGSAKHCPPGGEGIAKGDIRVGSLDAEAGVYGRFVHLACWRVPHRVWLGLPNPQKCTNDKEFAMALEGMNQVVLCGFGELPLEAKALVIAHVREQGNWARARKKKKVQEPVEVVHDDDAVVEVKEEHKENVEAMVRHREHFIIPIPGKKGARKNSLQGQTCVLTGIFPEVGGGAGLNLGKDKVKRMIQAFGGRVTSSVSGKTDILVVGKQPGYAKVSKARASAKCTLMQLKELKGIIEGAPLLENGSGGKGRKRPALVITEFSSGYRNNSVAYRLGAEEKAEAAGFTTTTPDVHEDDMYSQLKVVELRAECKRRKLKVGGRKSILIQRLREHDATTPL